MTTRHVDDHQLFLLRGGLIPTDRPFTASQTIVSQQELSGLVAEGYLRRVVRGVFAASDLEDTLALRAAALGLVVPRHTVVTDRTAAWLHGVDVLLPGEDIVVPDVQVFDRQVGGRVRRPGVGSGQRTMPDADVEQIGTVMVTTPLRTAIDLGRQRFSDRAFAQAEAMVRAGVPVDAIMRELRRFKGYRWIRQLRDFAPLLDPRPDSIAESMMRFRWIRAGFPRPEPQRPVTGPKGEEWLLDMGVDDLWLAVEYDGEEFHGPDRAEHDVGRRSWVEHNTPWMVRVIRKENLFGHAADFEELLPGWIREARATLGQRLRRGRRWYAEIGD